MHASTLVILETRPADIEAAVAEALAPYGKGREWDWYQIGGRWSGHLDGYDPITDPKNIETCDPCGGTGDRKDDGDCNNCGGRGKRVTWPTAWGRHDGDIKTVSALTDTDLKVCNMVLDRYGWFSNERYVPWARGVKLFEKLELPPLAWLRKTYPQGIAVIVDCHN